MGWFKRRPKPSTSDNPSGVELAHLEQFVRTRRGVEAYVEPKTAVTAMTVILIAFDGEWTRRKIGTPQQAMKFAARLGIPIYDIAAVGYPPKMREWNRRQKELRNPK